MPLSGLGNIGAGFWGVECSWNVSRDAESDTEEVERILETWRTDTFSVFIKASPSALMIDDAIEISAMINVWYVSTARIVLSFW